MLPTPDHSASVLEAVRDELLEAGEDARLGMVRLGVRLKPDDLAELRSRLATIGEEFVERDDPDGLPVGILLLAHRRLP
jgi:hypothetical protein